MLQLVRSVLETLGVEKVYDANDGQSGYVSFQRNKPDIVITDWHMEPMSGLDFVNKIRNDKNSHNKMVPIMMMTGFSAIPRVERARDVGVTEFLVKPFSANDLARRLAHVINKPRDFVETADYFGPDRRRKKRPSGFGGPFRRDSDI